MEAPVISSDQLTTSKVSEDECSIRDEEDPPGRKKKVDLADCDIYDSWSHLKCAKDPDSSWCNTRKSSWLFKDCS